jgi:hypothetical protein
MAGDGDGATLGPVDHSALHGVLDQRSVDD